jgi:succinate dehydrogenase subunit D
MKVRPHRRHPLWLAFLLHRVSGLLLAVFLPVHFLVLATALRGEAALDGFLHWTDAPAVKLAEFGLVFLLAVHLFGGLRLLALEFLPWSPRHKTYAAGVTVLALLLSCTFLLSAVQ